MTHPIPRATSAHELERGAFNTAFDTLGLDWHWDSATYDSLCAAPCERQRVRQYIEEQRAHLLRAYDADSLADAIVSVKQRCRQMAA